MDITILCGDLGREDNVGTAAPITHLEARKTFCQTNPFQNKGSVKLEEPDYHTFKTKDRLIGRSNWSSVCESKSKIGFTKYHVFNLTQIISGV